DSAMARSDDPTSLLRLVLRGSRSVATKEEPTAPGMPSFAWQLNDAQIAAVATYVRNHWGNPAPAISQSEVAQQRSSLSKRSDCRPTRSPHQRPQATRTSRPLRSRMRDTISCH